jgi:hypothetical protein
MLLGCSNVSASWDICDNLLASPTAIEDFRLGLAEAPFQIGNGASICAFSTEIVRVLEVDLMVCSTYWLVRNSLGV